VKGRQAVAPAAEKAEKSNPAPKVSFAAEPNTAPGTKSGKLPALVPAPVEDVSTDDESDVDESDDTFAMFETMTETDTDMLHALNQMATRQDESAQRAQGLDKPNLAPKPLSEKGKKTVARVTNRDTKWVRPPTLCENWDAWESIDAKRVGGTEIVNMTTPYSSTRVLCPDSGATNIMGPHRDMFVDYVDIQNENRYVRLGDESRRILIHGTGTLCLEVEGKRIAYANSLYVPQLSAILLSSRVHRRAAEGCSFLADHSGCFLTYPTFEIEIDDTNNDTDDCTINCLPIQDPSLPMDFDSRRHLTAHSSKEAVRVARTLAFQAMTTATLTGVQKAAGHAANPMTSTVRNKHCPDEDFPTVPVYSVSNSGIGETERINTTELKRYFGCRKFANWSMLETTGTGIKVIKDREGPSTIGDFATIRRNNHGKLLDQPLRALHTVGMDIGYGEGTSPRGTNMPSRWWTIVPVTAGPTA
jgi:hypothetical protein